MNQMEFTLRNGIAPPVTAVLTPTDLDHLAQLPVEAGVHFLLGRAECTEEFRQAFLATFNDPRAIVEIRQGERVQVLARQKALPATWLPTDSPTGMPALEIGVSRALSGG